jgi:hypothetical protein
MTPRSHAVTAGGAAAGRAAAAPAPRWRVHLPTAGETRVRAVSRVDPGAPWPSSRALAALLRAGAVRSGPPRSLGAGRGLPLIASQPVRWAGMEIEVECLVQGPGAVECNLVAPPWDELVAAEATEEAWWELVDGMLAAVDARHGAIVDGEAVALDEPSPATLRARLRRHLGLLVGAELVAAAGAAACAYRALPASGLLVLLH